MLPARYRMTKSSEFTCTVKRGMRSAHADLVIHVLSGTPQGSVGEVCVDDGPRVGLIVGKSVGGAVVRHRVSRQLRHAVAELLPELEPADRMVIRALPHSRHALFASLHQQLRDGVGRVNRKRAGVR